MRFLSFTISSDGISLIADQQILDLFEQGTLFQDEQDQHAYRVIQVHCDLETCGIPLAVEAHIDNLLYLSTFKSMNILVKFNHKSMISCADCVLGACRRSREYTCK